MSVFTQDNRGSSTELPAHDPRKSHQPHGASPVQYGQGKGRPGWTGGDQAAYDRESYHPFCCDAAENYRGPQADALNQRYQDINNGTYFTQDDASEQAPRNDYSYQGETLVPLPSHWVSVSQKVGR